MSKSLKNFITIRQALQVHSARQLRIMFLLQPWDKPMNFSDQTVGDAVAKERTFKAFFGKVKEISRSPWLKEEIGWRNREADRALYKSLQKCQSDVHDCLCDNFDTPGVMQAMVECVADANKYLMDHEATPAVYLLKKIAIYFTKILRILGVVEGADSIGFPTGSAGDDREAIIGPVLDCFLGFRDGVRTLAREKAPHQSFLKMCDSMRDDSMPELGVRIEDRLDGSGSAWNLDDPVELKRQVAAKREAEAQKLAKKRQNLILKKEAEFEKMSAAAVPENEFFNTPAQRAKYRAIVDGVPTELADGTPIKKGALKKAKKELQKHMKNQKALHKAAALHSDGDIVKYLEGLRISLNELKTS